MKIFERISQTVRDHPLWIIIAAALVTVTLGLGIMFLEGEVSYWSIMPEDFPSVKTLDALKNEFGGINYEYVLVETPSATSPELVRFLMLLPGELAEDERFNQGQLQTAVQPGGETAPVVQDYLRPFVATIRREMKKAGYDVPLSAITNEAVKAFTGKDLQALVEEDYLSNPTVAGQMEGFFITEDRRHALLILKAGAGLTEGEQVQLANDLESFFEEQEEDLQGTSFTVSGDPTMARDFDRHIRNKTVFLLLIALGFVIFTLFIAFRRFTDTLLPVAAMMLGLVWTFGFAGWIGIPYSVASIVVMPLLLGTALTFVVPFVARYYEEMGQGFRSVRAVEKALMTVGVAVFLAAVTNIFGFLVFRFSVLPPLKEFGLTCAVGTIFIFIISVTLLPAVMVLRDRLYDKRGEQASTHFDGLSRRRRRGLFARGTDRVLESFAGLSLRHSTLVIVVFAILILAGFIQIRSLTTDSDLRKLVPQDLPNIKADYEIEEVLGGQQQDIILVRGDVLSPEALKAMKAVADGIANDPENTFEGEPLYERDRTMSLPGVLTDANGGKLPETRQEAEQALATAEENGGYVEGGLLSNDHKAALITLDAYGASSPEAVDRKMSLLKKNADEQLGPADLRYQLGGITPLTNDMTRNIIPTETISSILSLVLCALVLVIIFRSIPFGLITLTVALAGVAAELGFMSLLNWPLDIITSLSSALVIGVGINFGILFTHRYIQEMELGDRFPAEAIRSTMMNLGRANIIAALATVFAFIIIMLSGIVPLQRFGGVTAFAIGWCLVTSLTLMPSLLYRLSRHLEAESEEEPLPSGA